MPVLISAVSLISTRVLCLVLAHLLAPPCKSYFRPLSSPHSPSSLNKCSYRELEKTAFLVTTASYTTPTLPSPARAATMTMTTSPSQIKRQVIRRSRSSSSRI